MKIEKKINLAWFLRSVTKLCGLERKRTFINLTRKKDNTQINVSHKSKAKVAMRLLCKMSVTLSYIECLFTYTLDLTRLLLYYLKGERERDLEHN